MGIRRKNGTINYAELFAKYDYLRKETSIVDLWLIMNALGLDI